MQVQFLKLRLFPQHVGVTKNQLTHNLCVALKIDFDLQHVSALKIQNDRERWITLQSKYLACVLGP
jgi:hypothetical protein